MNAVKDKKTLTEELAAQRAMGGGSNSGGGRRLSGALAPISVGSVMSPSSQVCFMIDAHTYKYR